MKKVKWENVVLNLGVSRGLQQFRDITYSSEVMNYPVIHLAMKFVFENLDTAIEEHRQDLRKLNDKMQKGEGK